MNTIRNNPTADDNATLRFVFIVLGISKVVDGWMNPSERFAISIVNFTG